MHQFLVHFFVYFSRKMVYNRSIKWKRKEYPMYKFLENVVKLENQLMQDVIANEGIDNEMANFYAQDRNDVIKAKDLHNAGKIAELKQHVDYLDTYIREGVVMAFVADLGSEWVEENLGWSVA
tara:strand:- start:905 stop:1273 length:369 start_codon:yes stop_codon:yes gene_type:complete